MARLGDARVALMGFPSVGKSTLLGALTGTESEAAAYGSLYFSPTFIHFILTYFLPLPFLYFRVYHAYMYSGNYALQRKSGTDSGFTVGLSFIVVYASCLFS